MLSEGTSPGTIPGRVPGPVPVPVPMNVLMYLCVCVCVCVCVRGGGGGGGIIRNYTCDLHYLTYTHTHTHTLFLNLGSRSMGSCKGDITGTMSQCLSCFSQSQLLLESQGYRYLPKTFLNVVYY